MSVSWVYKLSKNDIIEELTAHNVEAAGSIDDLRQRLVAFIRAHPDKFLNKPSDMQKPESNENISQENSSSQDLINMQNTANVLDQMRKWNCHFDGRDLYSFLERVEELKNAYQFTDDQFLQGFPELLRGDAQLWYRNTIQGIRSWSELEANLKSFYLSPNERRHLTNLIENRRQGSTEPIRSFVTSLTTLMRRRGGYSPEEMLDLVYYKMTNKFRLYIKRNEIKSINDLIQRVDEIEETLRIEREEERKTSQNFRNRGGVMALTSNYDRSSCCWKCKQRGHDRFQCRNAQKKFCSYCGKDGILTKNCKCHPENAVGAETNQRSRPTSTRDTI